MEQMLNVKLLAIVLFSVGLGMSNRYSHGRLLARDVARSLLIIGGLTVACVTTQIMSAMIYPPTEIIVDYRLMLVLGGQSILFFFCLCVTYSFGSIFGVDVSLATAP